MLQKTKDNYDEIDELIEEARINPPKMFPYTTREIAAKFGMGNSHVYAYMISKGLFAKGKRWFFRHNEERHE